LVPEDEVIRVACDDTTKKKAGRHSEGRDRYRHGAGSARQAYRTLQGVNVVVGLMRLPLQRWPGPCLSVPLGLELSLKEAQAHQLGVPYRFRSQLARDMLDCAAAQLPERSLRSLADGGYATKDSVRGLPATLHAVERFPIRAKLYEVPPGFAPKCRGAPRKKGALIGSPNTLAETASGWVPHPTEAVAERQAWCGVGHAVLPGRLIRVVVLRRDPARRRPKPGQRKPRPALEAFVTTDLALCGQDVLREYADRGSSEEEPQPALPLAA
jgi:hypothetical protein